MEKIGKHTTKYRVKSRNFTARGMDIVMELSVKNPQELAESIRETKAAENFSIIEYDSDDVI